ncbi:unnamed protein product [Gongylonema pulchrum]|uniref:Uncharacterized protein n=1 Tax=Gongylonema pulchrum TaxID=637853 RepID=A0A183ENV2_9BILA|nr:unnamed protein product [Gongylonema pulchrum]
MGEKNENKLYCPKLLIVIVFVFVNLNNKTSREKRPGVDSVKARRRHQRTKFREVMKRREERKAQAEKPSFVALAVANIFDKDAGIEKPPHSKFKHKRVIVTRYPVFQKVRKKKPKESTFFMVSTCHISI